MTPNPYDRSIASEPIALGWLCLLAAAWIVPGLIGHDPWKPDEAYTFGLVYSILNDGAWIVPMLAGEPFLEKPPLYLVSAAATAALFSPPFALHDAARLATGIYMALAFVFVGAAARELHGPNRGPLAVLTLIGCLGLQVRGHQLITDVALVAGLAAAFYGFALALRRPVLAGFWLGTGIGVGFMSKGLLAPATVGLVALVLPLFPAWRTRSYLVFLGVAAAACAPWLVAWPLALYLRSPALLDQWLWVENLGRLLGTEDTASASRGYFLRILPWYTLPALPLAAWALWRARTTGVLAPAYALPLVAFAATLAMLSLLSDARDVYALPLLLPLVLLAAPGTDTLRRGAANLIYWFSVMGCGFFIIVAWFYWSALELGMPPRLHAHLHRIQPGYTPGFKWVPFVFGALYSAAWIALVVRLRKTRERPLIAWAASITVVWGLLAILFGGWVDVGKSYRSTFVDMQKATPPKYDCMASKNLGEPQRAMLHYVGGVVTWRMEDPGRQRDCELVLVQGIAGEEYVPLGPWQKIWEGARPGDKVERYRLYQRIDPKRKGSGGAGSAKKR